MNRLLVSIGLAAMLVLAMPSSFNNFAGAQEDHDHADHTAEIAAAGPSVDDAGLAVELVGDGLVFPTTMAFLDEDTILVLEKDNGTVRVIEGGELQAEPLLDVAVANDNERGMLGIAVSRENATTTYVFLYFTESGGGVDGAIFRIVTVDESEAETGDLTVRSANLAGDTITGMFTTVKASNGTVLWEGYTPLTFRGDEGSSYTVTVADFGNREFDHWDNDSTNRARTVTLDGDTTITAHYEIKSTASSNTVIIDRLARILDKDGCFDDGDQRRLGNAISRIIQDIFGENQMNTDRLERALDRIVEDCEDDGDNNDRNRRGQGNDDNRDQGRNDDDDEDEEENDEDDD